MQFFGLSKEAAFKGAVGSGGFENSAV